MPLTCLTFERRPLETKLLLRIPLWPQLDNYDITGKKEHSKKPSNESNSNREPDQGTAPAREPTKPGLGRAKSILVQVEQQVQRINAARWILTERLTLISDTDNCPEVEVLLWPHSLHMLHMELSCRAALRALWKMFSGGVFSDEVPNTSTLYSQRNAYICQYSHEHHHTAVNV